MGLETFTGIWSFNSAWPVGVSDLKSAGDDHLRGIKAAILTTFPNITAAVTVSHTVLNGVQNASNLTSGTIPDARLSGNVAMLNAASTNWSGFAAFNAAGSAVTARGLSSGNANNVFVSLEDSTATRQGRFAKVGGTTTVELRNDISGGALELATTGGGNVTVNAQNVRDAALFNSGTLGLARGGTGQTTQLGITREVTKAWTIASDPGGTPSGTAGDVFAYY